MIYFFSDINECTSDLPMDPNGPCSVGATCINIVGGYQCECPPGTSGDAYKGGCKLFHIIKGFKKIFSVYCYFLNKRKLFMALNFYV